MRHLRVDDSSNVSEISHDPASNTLTVSFRNGGKYRYANVQAHQFGALAQASSVGKALQPIIRRPEAHPHTKLEGERDPQEGKVLSQLEASVKLGEMRKALEQIRDMESDGDGAAVTQANVRDVAKAFIECRKIAREVLK